MDDIKIKSVPVYEQETIIGFMRDEDFASIYSSDTTMITKLDRLCKNNPNMYQLIEDTGNGKRYRLLDKTLISLRNKKKELSEEQRQKASERFKNYHANKSV